MIRRVGVVLLVAAVLAALSARRSEQPTVLGRYSRSYAILLGSAWLAGCFLMVGACRPNSRLGRLMQRRIAVSITPPTSASPADRRLGVTALMVAACAFVVIWQRGAIANRRPTADEPAVLELTREFADHGMIGSVLRMLTGDYRETNRHPLQPMLLALASPTADFTVGKWLSGLGGVLTVLALGWWGWRVAGPLVGGLAACGWAVNAAAAYNSAIVACESWLTLGCVLFFMTATTMPDRPMLIGVLGGLAFLAKYSAFIPIAGWVGWTLCQSSTRPRFSTVAWLLLGFIIVTGPLLIRNQRVFGKPFVNVNSRLFGVPPEQARDHDFDYWLYAPEFDPSAYFRSTPTSELARRLGVGTIDELFVLCRASGPVFPYHYRPRAALGAIVVLLFGAALLHRLMPAAGYFAGLLVVMVVVCGWYRPVSDNDRFLLPILPAGVLGASLLLSGLVRSRQLLLGVMAGTLLLAVAVHREEIPFLLQQQWPHELETVEPMQ